MDSGCILLDNFKEKRYWDVGNSIGLGSNKYFKGFDPSLNIVNLYEKDNTEYNLIDLSDNDSCQEIYKSAGLSRIENLKSTISNINRTRLINVDKSQLPSIKILQDGKVDLPTLGLKTLENLLAKGFLGVVAEADKTLLIHQKACQKFADKEGLFVFGWEEKK